jgi:hypothetical protein
MGKDRACVGFSWSTKKNHEQKKIKIATENSEPTQETWPSMWRLT